MDMNSASMKAHRVFLKLLDAFTSEGRSVNASSGPNYAPSAFASDPRAEKVTKAAFKRAMQDLFANSQIRSEIYGRSSRIERAE